MGSLLKEYFDIEPTAVGNDVAQKFYEQHHFAATRPGSLLAVFFASPLEKVDIQFFINNHKFFSQAQKSYIWNAPANFPLNGALPLSSADVGIYSYFEAEGNAEGEFDPKDGSYRRMFIIYAGAFLAHSKNVKDYKNSQTVYQNDLIKKTFYKFEKEGGAFKEVAASVSEFSLSNFKIALSNSINSWLDQDTLGPMIQGLVYITRKAEKSLNWELRQPTIHANEATAVVGRYGGADMDELLNYYESRYTAAQKTQIYNLGFHNSYAFYKRYLVRLDQDPDDKIPDVVEIRENTIRADEDLETTAGAKFKPDIDYITSAHWRIAEPLFRENYSAMAEGMVSGLKLAPARSNFIATVERFTNKTNIPGLGEGGALDRGQVGYRFAQFVLNDLRVTALKLILKQFREDPYRKTVSEAQLSKIFKKAEEIVKNNEEITGKDIDAADLSDDDIEAKQKFLKQCLLMSRLSDMARMNIGKINSKQGIHKEIPYKGRFYSVRDQGNDSSSIINKLLIPNIKDIEAFKNITPAEHASLVPKIRLVKVSSENGQLREHEFKFPNKVDSNRVNSLFSTDFDKGSDFGIKEFSFSFDGTSPATAKNDIKATLKLYFQSFEDFIKEHPLNVDKHGKAHRYVDLLVLPSKDKEEKTGSGLTSPLQFHPSYYRIRVDLGWEADSAPNEEIKKAIQKLNKTFYLNMVDHEINIRDDGSVDINVSYRAYIESALKGAGLDALSSRESRLALERVRKEYQDVVSTSACTNKQLSTIRSQFLQIEENLKRTAFQSIIKRLVKYGLLNHVIADSAAANSFAKTGFLSNPAVFERDNRKQGVNSNQLGEKSNVADFVLDMNVFRDIDLSNSSDNLLINYFYLGDLLYVVLDCLYILETENKDINETYTKETENFKFILGSFDFIDIFNNSSTETINLANIPISVELFNEWFTENVVKSERNSYPVMYFIRDITKYLVGDILLESCFKNDLDKRLQFKTNSFLGKKTANSETDPIGDLLLQSKEAVLDVNTYYKSGDLPLQADINGVSTSIKDLFNYITIYVDSPRIKTDKVGKKFDDENNGIMHYQLGKSRGILKKIKFSKSDAKYLREARFFRHGHDGLLQLAAHYRISMDMVGNTLYYPGMEVFIDPVGLIGAGSNFDPRIRQSVANKLGFGGYHLIDRVKSTIGPGKFTTNVEAIFSYSGDGDPKSRIIGTKDELKIATIDEDQINEKPQTKNQKDYCQGVSDQLYRRNAELGYGHKQKYGGLEDKKLAEKRDKVVNQAESIRQERVRENTATFLKDNFGITEPPTDSAPKIPEVPSYLQSLSSVINKKPSSAYTETEAFTNRKYYDEGGKRYYEDDPDNPVDL